MKEPCELYIEIVLHFLQNFLKKDKSVTIHQKNLQVLATEIFKTKNGLNPEIMKNIFSFIEPVYHLKSNNRLERHNLKSVKYKTETISQPGPKIWNILLEEFKEIDSLSIFKRNR